MQNIPAPTSIASLVMVTIASVSTAAAQLPGTAPSHADVAYSNENPAQKLDVCLAKSNAPTPAMVFIHGGGWRAGSKNNVPSWLKKAVADGWLSVISVEYRFTNVAPHPAQVNDCLRAIQFVRENAKQWNIDPDRIGVTGGSAGGHLSLYVALHDDIANRNATESILRQSSRVQCAVSFAGPTDWSLLGTMEHKHPAYRQLIGYEPGTRASQMDEALKTDVSPISFVSSDDPPVMQVHGDNDDIVPVEHAKRMHEQLKQNGVRSELVIIAGADHGVAGAAPQVSERANDFVKTILAP